MDDLQPKIEEMRRGLAKYKPGMEAQCPDPVKYPNNLFIGLFGRTGCGKTSLINSILFAVRGGLRKDHWIPVATLEKHGGDTLKRTVTCVSPIGIEKSPHKIYVVDNRGLDRPTDESAKNEISAQIDGKRGYAHEVSWYYADKSAERDASRHVIGCVVFVFSAQESLESSTTGLSLLIDFLRKKQGRYPVGVLTNVDRAKRPRVDRLKYILNLAGINEVFEVANIHENKPMLEIEYQHALLSFLGRCITDSDHAAVFKYYQKQAMIREEEMRQEEENARKAQEEVDAEKERLYQEALKKAAELKRMRNKEETKNNVVRGVALTSSTTATGAIVGTFIAGPIGTAVGAGIGGAVGALTGIFTSK